MRIISPIILCIVIYSCSGGLSSIYEFNYSLSNEIAHSKTSNLAASIPVGWFTAEDNECNCIDLWLIKDDYSATLNFTTINIINNKEISIDKAAEYSKTFIRAKMGKQFKKFFNEEIFDINQNQFYAYEYVDQDNRNIRVVVFKHKEKFYELKAIPAEEKSVNDLFITQNSVLTSLN